MRYLALLTIVAAASMPGTVRAQNLERLYPLDVGNVWEFEVAQGSSIYEGARWTNAIQLSAYLRRSVIGDTLLDGTAYRLVRVDSLAPDYTPLADALCAVRFVAETGMIEWVPVSLVGGGTCWAPERGSVDLRAGDLGGEIHVGAIPYSGLVSRTWWAPYFGYVEVVEDFGFLEWSRGRWYDIDVERYVMRAVYAMVEGEEYGRPITSEGWHDFYPLYEGDVREYFFRGNGGGRIPPDTLYFRWDVGADTLLDGVSHRIIRETQYDASYSVTGTATCGVRIDGSGSVRTVRFGEERCRTFPPTWVDLRTNTWTAEQGEGIASGTSIKTFEYEDNSTIGYEKVRYRFGRGLGMVGVLSLSHSFGHTISLTYAEVDGVIFGAPLLSTGGSAEDPAISFVGVYPNPFSEHATFFLQLSEPGQVGIEVFDTLGRLVLRRELGSQPTGASEHRLDAAASLPAGLYVVRATTASGATSTQRIIKVD